MRTYRPALVVLLILVVVLIGIWAARRPLSEAAVSQWLAGQGVEARYRVTAISPGAVTLADVSLGPAARPDFTAERIEATVGWSPLRPRIDAVTLVRPRLRATVTKAGISFGAVDRLLPAPAATPQPLPDIDVTVVGGQLVAATLAGPLAATIDGRGRLRDGFRGFGTVAPATLALAGCSATLAETRYAVAMRRDDVGVTAAGGSPRLACAAATAEGIGWRLAATLPPMLDRYAATLAATTARVTAGDARADRMTLAADATAATLGGPVAGKFDASLAGASAAALRARTTAVRGSYRLDPATGFANGQGVVSVASAAAALPQAPLRDAARSVRGTLAAPLLDRLVARSNAAVRDFTASARVAAVLDRAGLRATVTALDARAASGARLVQNGSLEVARGRAVWVGDFALMGGGLPATTLAGRGEWRDGRFRGGGRLAMARFAVPGAAFDALQLDAQGGGSDIRLDGGIRVSGALGGGVVAQRLGLPVALTIGSGRLRFGTRCLALDWAALSQGTLRTGPGRATVCPAGGAVATLAGDRLSGGATVSPLALRGTAGTEPLTLSTQALRLALSGTTAHPILALAPARIDLGYGARRVRATVAGRLDLAAAVGSGRIDAASLADPASPVNIDTASGAWRLAAGRLALSGGVARVTDRTAPARFQPIRIGGLTASLADGRVTARGDGALLSNGARLFGFTAVHDLASAAGHADVDTGVLTFGPDLQPYEITESLRGVVDNVRGPVSGTGRLDWVGDRITSRGTARIDHVSLATASLGPVDDVAGSLVFDDLLAMTTPTGQTLTIKRINPGIAVDDGIAVFRLLGPDAAEIASMVWPYAGGTLTLAPVTIRAADARRDFVLSVDNLDGEQFLQKFEIKNLNVTGRFDGRLPLVFEGTKGRIEGGKLVARAGGGLVQYVGDVANSDLGGGAKLAFDALRRLRYQNLALDFDGDLDGELVTQLRFAGTNEAATTLGGGPLPIRATGLPFKFNVTVRAPFRALLGTAASFSDVRPLIRPAADGVQPR